MNAILGYQLLLVCSDLYSQVVPLDTPDSVISSEGTGILGVQFLMPYPFLF